MEKFQMFKSFIGGGYLLLRGVAGRPHTFAYSFWLRLGKVDNSIIRFIAKVFHHHLSVKYGIQIPIETKIGRGLYIGHGIGIVVNGKTRIGENCNISQFLTIGSNKGTPAVIGDNVYIGPHVCLVEDVKIGNNSKIGAGAVVVKDVPDSSVAVGNPARIIIH
jgi:serine O-acetyltransferase